MSGKARRFEIAYLSVFVAYENKPQFGGAETANHLAKGQLILKCLSGVFNSPKKRTKTIRLEVPIFSFVFGRIEDTKKIFRDQLTCRI